MSEFLPSCNGASAVGRRRVTRSPVGADQTRGPRRRALGTSPRDGRSFPRPAPASRTTPAPCTMCHDNTGRTPVMCVLAHGGTNLMRNKAAWLRAAAGLAAARLVLPACSQSENTGSGDYGGDNAKPSPGRQETPVADIQEGKVGGTFRLAIT